MDEPRKITNAAIKLAGFGVAAFFASIFVYVVWFKSAHLSVESQDWGTFGDYISGVAGTFISLATLIAVVFTLGLQEKELAETRKELKNQATTMSRQQFEGTFFSATRLLDKIEGEVWNPSDANPLLQGRRSFDSHAQNLNAAFGGTNAAEGPVPQTAVLRAHFATWYRSNSYNISSYFEVLLQLLELIDRSGLEDRQIYANILRASLSPAQKYLVFHYGILHDNPRGLKTLLERYAFFANYDFTHPVATPANRKGWYAAEIEGFGVQSNGRAV